MAVKDLPREYRSVRLESLPESLQAKAEELVRKKFGLAPLLKKEKKPKSSLTPDTSPVYPYDITFTISIRDCIISNSINSLATDIIFRCPRCSYENGASIHSTSMVSPDAIHSMSNICRCRAKLEVRFTASELSRFSPRPQQHIYTGGTTSGPFTTTYY